ncbi:myocyte-specific enhancer factor 2A-like isoform X1 [Ictalurus furcatus]|uniref:myocyte-specific enhancer factor 2A-like isoform X1 n=1 Tax=Ictalurus furcatus TaxID=66913 RepID=UPI00234FE483|nr:myocyte-specific enhancer factor 2A-like isoform X1 [Ictalurus furcatus]XP_053490848.1 myocyte-specific enhancer factor 2A-like isoform X1 [Ictalurus furcatus]XP_053490849.1 myocyte-specific enhancer factor 2A-like isoform X1 [Ictalurus furcatus]
MGRKKIQITRIVDERNRQVTFTKRKFGLMKKAYELSVLCDCEIALIIFNSSNKLFQYASTDMDKVLLKYTEYNEPHESRTNSDIVEALNKKEQRGSESPEVDTCPYVLTPHTEEKYQKINEEFDNMMRSHKMPAVLSQQSFPMPLALPVSEHSVHSYSSIGALGEAGMLSPSSNTLQRSPNTRLAGQLYVRETGVHTSSDHTPNGVHSASIVNSYISAQGENSMGRGPTAKSAASPTGNLTPIGHKPELRVLVPPSCKISPALRINSPPSSQSLSTQGVSMTTSSMHPQGLPYPAMTSAYSSDYGLNSSELNNLHGFSMPDNLTLASVSPWQHTQIAITSQGVSRSLSHVSEPSSRSSPIMDIKAEPVSPPMAFLSAPPSSSLHSPAESLASSCSSYEGSEREEQCRDAYPSVPTPGQGNGPSEGIRGPSLKRLRTESWVT